MRKGGKLILKKIRLNSFREKQLSILTSCMANLAEFHIMFSSSTLIRVNKATFEGHLCQTVNNCVKQN